jgi:hypothetical protein
MSGFDPKFEIGFPRPSLENPVLFSRYADQVEAYLKLRFAPHEGYRVKVKKSEEDPRKRNWRIDLLRGWASGASIRILPIREKTHRAMVEVRWHSRFVDFLQHAFVYISFPFFALFFILLLFQTRAGFALLLTVTLGLAWMAVGAIVLTLAGRLFALVFGNEFTYERRRAIAEMLKTVPLPQPQTKPQEA